MIIKVKQHCSGFTLIEVLVALAIIALSLGALITSSGSQASQAGYLKQKTIAHWVAMNEITELQVTKTFPDTGKTDGRTEMADHEWYWTRVVKKTEDENSRQVEFEVFSDKKRNNNITRLTSYLIK